MRVLITGATGLIGSKLVEECLDKGISVNYLTTSKDKIESSENYKGFYWNPDRGEINNACFQDVDAIVHLAGASISKRWTKSYKEEIIESRLVTTNFLYSQLKKESHQVKHFITASGINIYKSDFHLIHAETSKAIDTSFLANVVSTWENVADKFENEGLTVSKIRTGMVLDKNDGALPKLMQPVKLGFGAPIASGKQWQSWIHIEDIARLYVFVIKNKLDGIYNAVAPQPVTNAEMTKRIAKELNKPLWLPNVPAFVLKMLLGEMATLVLSSQQVSCQKIEDAGFVFNFPTLKSALKDLFNN